MKKRGGKNTKPQLYSHIASAIIPSVGIVAVPSAAYHFPRQKLNANEKWGPLASTLLRASSTSQLFVPFSSVMTSQEELQYIRSTHQPVRRRKDRTTDDDESDDDDTRQRQKSLSLKQTNNAKGGTSHLTSVSNAEKRLFGYHVKNDESISTDNDTGESSTVRLDPKQALTAELSRSVDEKIPKRTSVSITHQQYPGFVQNPVQSQAGPTSARSGVGAENIDGDSKLSTTIPRSSLNDTNIPTSVRSVSFKEPMGNQNNYSAVSKSPTTDRLAYNSNSVLKELVLPPPTEYQQSIDELGQRNLLLNSEIQQLRINNQNLQRQHEELFNRLQTSEKISHEDMKDLLKQSGHDQIKDLINLTQTLQDRCGQLQKDLDFMKDKYEQSQNQSGMQELKKENHFLKDYIHRLNAASSEYQTMHPPKTLKKEMNV